MSYSGLLNGPIYLAANIPLIFVTGQASTKAYLAKRRPDKRIKMPVTTTPIYSFPMVILFIALSVQVIRYRRANRLPLGDAGDRELLAHVRAQGNCAEYMPLGLLLLIMAELAGASAIGLHTAGLSLCVGRMIHAAHLSFLPNQYTLRVVAVTLTFASYLVAVGLTLL